METQVGTLQGWAERVFFGDTLEEKFLNYDLKNAHDIEAKETRWSDPGRPANLQIADRKERKKLPKPTALHDANMRVRTLHTFANHELMAIELCAFALLRFPEAPPSFRLGVAHILQDEQRHLQLYIDRMAEFGASLGDLPVNDHFWRCAPLLDAPLKWVCAVNLTFEQANLDHAPAYALHFRKVEDETSARLMELIAEEEVDHVGFGAQFLNSVTPKGESTFDNYVNNLTFHNTPDRARGVYFSEGLRQRTGLDDDFIRTMRELF